MSVEQWAVLALVVLLPLLEVVARFRRAHAGNRESADRIGEMGTSHLPPPALPPAISLSGLRASHASSLKGSSSFEVHRRSGKPVAGDAVVQSLRPVRNLRRAIVVATILGPPMSRS